MPDRLALISLGGTIASVRDGSEDDGVPGGAVPKLGAADLAGQLTLPDGLVIEAYDLSRVGSSSLAMSDVVALVGEVDRAVAAGVRGVVIAQGTDTLEEVSFLLDLVYAGRAPVVVTGAMRNASALGADGSVNLSAAVATALSPGASGQGVLAVLNDTIHSPWWVSKSHTANVGAFVSSTVGPMGWVSEGVPRFAFQRSRRTIVEGVDLDRLDAERVGLVSIGLSDDGKVLQSIARLGYQGVVIQALGGGHVPSWLMPEVRSLTEIMPVVVASRTGAGSVLRETYGFEGAEMDLADAGAISAGSLDAYKARLLLAVALAKWGDDLEGARVEFDRVASSV